MDLSAEYVQILVCGWINCLNELNRSEEALIMEQYYENFCNYADFVLLMGHVYTNTGQPIKALGEYIKATTIPLCHSKGANSYLPFFYMGNLYHALGDDKIAKMMYEKSGDYPKAQEALKQP